MPSKGVHLEVRRGADMVDLLNIDEQPYYLFGSGEQHFLSNICVP